MIRDAAVSDLPLIRDILRRANDVPYDFNAVAEEKCFGRGYRGEPRVRIHGEQGVAVHCGRYLRLIAVDRDRRGRGIGTALLRDARSSVVGAEPGNYFVPGVLESSAGFFQRRGFRITARAWNLHVALSARFDAPAPGIVRVEERDGIPAELQQFVQREFGKIWSFEVGRARTAFWIPKVGFAAVEANNRGLGTFGPTGIAPAHRGKGHGRALLLAAMAELAGLGYGRAIIPWTDAPEFYRKSCGAEPAHRFVTLTAC